MKHPFRSFKNILILVLCTVLFIACKTQQKNSEPVAKKQDDPVAKKQEVKAKASGYMTVSFRYPVVMINGQRAQKKESEYREWIEVSYPENSTSDLKLTVVDSQGAEQELFGQIKVFKHTQNTKWGGEQIKPVEVAPENAEFTYASIARNGYGELSVRENISDPDKGRIQGEVLVQLILGAKKKKG